MNVSLVRRMAYAELESPELLPTRGEIESAICKGMARFELQYMGQGPRDVHAHLIGDLLVVRSLGVLTSAEKHLAKTLPEERGRDLLKQVRTQLIEVGKPILESLVQDVTSVKLQSMHHDISTITGEQLVVFTLAEAPRFRDCKRNGPLKQSREN